MSDKSGEKKTKKSTKKSAKKSEKSTETKQKTKTLKKASKSPKATKSSVKSPKTEKPSKTSRATKKQTKASVKPKVNEIADGVYIGIELDNKYLIQKFHPVMISTKGKKTDLVLEVEIIDQKITIANSEINTSVKPPIEILSEKVSNAINMPIVIVLDAFEKVNIPKFEPFFLKDLLYQTSAYGYPSNFGTDETEDVDDPTSQIEDLIQSLNENIVEAFDNQFSYRL